MKRSQVLREIYILLHCGPDYPTEDEILDKLEELGMLPPDRWNNEGDCYVNEWTPE